MWIQHQTSLGLVCTKLHDHLVQMFLPCLQILRDAAGCTAGNFSRPRSGPTIVMPSFYSPNLWHLLNPNSRGPKNSNSAHSCHSWGVKMHLSFRISLGVTNYCYFLSYHSEPPLWLSSHTWILSLLLPSPLSTTRLAGLPHLKSLLLSTSLHCVVVQMHAGLSLSHSLLAEDLQATCVFWKAPRWSLVSSGGWPLLGVATGANSCLLHLLVSCAQH